MKGKDVAKAAGRGAKKAGRAAGDAVRHHTRTGESSDGSMIGRTCAHCRKYVKPGSARKVAIEGRGQGYVHKKCEKPFIQGHFG